MARSRFVEGALVGFASATLLILSAMWFVLRSETMQARYHWNRVHSLLQYVNDPENLESSGGVREPYDVMPSLAALVSLGELDHVDLVFPRVAAGGEVFTFLNLYCHSHPNIVYMSMNPVYQRFPLEGAKPLHLNLWYKLDGEVEVRELIEEIEGTYSAPDNEPT